MATKNSSYKPVPNTVGYTVMNGPIDQREEGLRILSRESDRQMLLKELSKKAKKSKDPAEVRSINSTLKKFGYVEKAPNKNSTKSKTINKAANPVSAPAKKATAAKSTTFTVKGKTFATKAEAKAYEKECKKNTGKAPVIRESRRKPSHRVVSFIAKNK